MPAASARDKALAAAARALRANRHDEALEQAKVALKEPGGEDCAAVHVAFGMVLAAREEEAAERAFRRALDINDQTVAAWRGLAGLLEAEQDERSDELLEAYEKLVSLTKESGKGGVEWVQKLKDLQRSLGLDDQPEGRRGACTHCAFPSIESVRWSPQRC